MNDLGQVVGANRSQWAVYSVLSVAVLGLAAVSTVLRPAAFRPYFGALPPLLVVSLVVVLGAAVWAVVLPRGWFVVAEPGSARRSLPVVLGLPTLLAAGMIVVDVVVVLPPDHNVRFPGSLAFYPTIGFVVEVVFHLVPLTMLLLIASTRMTIPDRPRLLWGAVVLVALVEPLFQVGLGFSRAIPLWATAYVAVNVFAVNLAQLVLLRRFGFLSGYAFRLVYYLLWHVAWGHLRLRVLF